VAVSADTAERGWTDTLEMTRAMFGVSLGTSQEWMKGLCEWQQAQVVALQSATARFGEAAGRAADAPDWPALFALQAELASTQWAEALQEAAHHWTQWLDVESRLFERGREDAARLSQRWLDNAGTGWSPLTAVAPLPALLDADRETAADSDTPLAMLGQAQAAWSEMLRVWTQGANFAAMRE
jgi:hypothetical protein